MDDMRDPRCGGDCTVNLNRARRGCCRITIRGELDLAAASLVRAAVMMSASMTTDLVEMDLAGVSFCDAAGVAALVSGAEVVAGCGHQLRLLAVSDPARRVLTITGTADRLETRPRPNTSVVRPAVAAFPALAPPATTRAIDEWARTGQRAWVRRPTVGRYLDDALHPASGHA